MSYDTICHDPNCSCTCAVCRAHKKDLPAKERYETLLKHLEARRASKTISEESDDQILDTLDNLWLELSKDDREALK